MMTPATMVCLQLEAQLSSARDARRAAMPALRAAVPALRAVVSDAQADLRRRLEARRTGGLTRSVLVLDDDPTTRDLMATTLAAMLAVPVYRAATVGEAKVIWSERRPSLVVVDLFLAGGHTGDDFIRDLDHAVRAILVSGVADLVTLTTAAAQVNAIALSKDRMGELPSLCREQLDEVHPPLWCRASMDALREVSPALAALLGETPEALMGQSWRDRVHPEDLARSEAERERRAGQGVEGFRQRMRRADGSYVTLVWNVTPMTDGVVYAVARRVV